MLSRDIAIVGFSCRAASAPDYEHFWHSLTAGKVHFGLQPAARKTCSVVWDEGALSRLNESATIGGYLDKVDRFDHHLFQISAREARSIDPQHRLLMEEAWRALQDAGMDPRRPSTAPVGVFMGLCSFDYALLSHEAGESVGPYSAIGGALCLAANRISHTLGLSGPSITVDAACASSLVAVHLACESLLSGDCDLALAGGANLILTPTVNASFQAARMLSAAGQCRPFDKQADGYVRSEAAGVVVLRRLQDALDAGDPIHAVIAASAVNQDGHTRGITVPSAKAQATLLRTCWEKAGISSANLAFVEAHGTGTPTGDPIEIEGLLAALHDRELDRGPCWLGSLKANFGHAEAAAGVLSLIKASLALERRLLPPHVGATSPIDALDRDKPRLRLVPSCVPLKPNDEDGHLHGGVSAFGFGGTNCHLLLRSAPAAAIPSPAPQIAVTLSSHDEDALRKLCEDWAAFFETASPAEAAAAGLFSIRAFSGEQFRVTAIGDQPCDLAEQLRRAWTERCLVQPKPTMLRIEASQTLDLLAAPARARIEAERPGRRRKEITELVRFEIETLVRSLFPQITLAGEQCLLVGGGDPDAARVFVVDASRTASLPTLLDLWCAGHAPTAAPLAAQRLIRPPRLPSYRFAERSHWLGHTNTPGASVEAQDADIALVRFDESYLAQHLVAGEAIVPGASILVSVLQRARARLGGTVEARDVRFESPLLAERAMFGVKLEFRAHGPRALAFELLSPERAESTKICYASGMIFSVEGLPC